MLRAQLSMQCTDPSQDAGNKESAICVNKLLMRLDAGCSRLATPRHGALYQY